VYPHLVGHLNLTLLSFDSSLSFIVTELEVVFESLQDTLAAFCSISGVTVSKYEMCNSTMN